MTDSEKLQNELAIGLRYKATYEELVEPYFAQKQLELFDAFKQASAHNKELLQDIKLQSNALEGLRQHFLHYIETGHMAAIKLNEGDK